MTPSSEVDKLVIIDGKNICYRAHWVHRFLASRGRCTSVLFGVPKMLVALAQRMPNTAFVFAWDGRGKNWRHEFSKGEYKAHRVHAASNDEIAPCFPQIPILKNALKNAGFRHFEVDNLEGDDLIGLLTTAAIEKNLFKQVLIHSTDKDFYQLATDRVGILRGRDHNEVEYAMYAEAVEEELGIEAKDWVKVKALIGDPGDNIPKLQTGLGPKTAIKLIQAGLNPALLDFEKHQWVVKQNFQVFRTMWPKVRSNYQLSHIVCDTGDPCISGTMRETLSKLVDGLSKESFLRDKTCLGDDDFSHFTEFIVEYEMQDLFASRHVLWKMA